MTAPFDIIHGDAIEELKKFDAGQFDAIVTDPPYGLEFMGKDWDSFKGEAWRAGAGMSKPGIGERPTAWPSFGGAESANPTCAICGGRKRGARKCGCAEPDWRVKGKPLSERNAGLEQMRAYQSWCEQWATECLRVAKPGAHLLAFGGTRTYHRLACAIEGAGWGIRDSLHWIYGTGFPKSLDVSKAIDKAAGAEREVTGHNPRWNSAPRAMMPGGGERSAEPAYTAPATDDAQQWQGWGTALKPAHEPILLARKPLAGTVAANVLEYGTGALNIDGCRVGTTKDIPASPRRAAQGPAYGELGNDPGTGSGWDANTGRWPSNVLLTHSEYCCIDECAPDCPVQEIGAESRFFPCFRYQAKAPKRERPQAEGVAPHPTVKPLELMRWLVRLVTPPNGLVLDPFAGTGTTAEACVLEGCGCVLIERDAGYLRLIEARMTTEDAA